jgi:cytochrome c biogenesis protein ResB
VKKLFDHPIFKFLSSIKLALPLILVILVLLAAGTVVESRYSAAEAQRLVYGAWWFSLVLFLLGLNVFCSAISRFPWKKHQTGFVVTHLGTLVILAGSFITQQYGLEGQVALIEGEEAHVFQTDKPLNVPLPFSLGLVKFNLGLDPGTDNPASYASDVYYRDPENQDNRVPANISMNQPLHHRGYTIYQAGYEALPGGKYLSIFAVGKDPGMFVKYAGAGILMIGLILMFWFKNPGWSGKGQNA